MSDAACPPIRRATSPLSPESPHMMRWSPNCQMSPRTMPVSTRAAASAASTSNVSSLSPLSRASRVFSSFATSSSPNPDNETSRSGTSWSSDSKRASNSCSHEPAIRFRARLRTLASSAEMSRKMTGTEGAPRRRAASSRWWPPITARSSRRAMIGSTRPKFWMLRVRASSSPSEIRRGFNPFARSSVIPTCSMARPEDRLTAIEPPVEVALFLWRQGQRQARPAGRRHSEVLGEFEDRLQVLVTYSHLRPRPGLTGRSDIYRTGVLEQLLDPDPVAVCLAIDSEEAEIEVGQKARFPQRRRRTVPMRLGALVEPLRAGKVPLLSLDLRGGFLERPLAGV